MHALLSLVLSAHWLSEVADGWFKHETFQLHIVEMKKALIAAMTEGEITTIVNGMSISKLLISISPGKYYIFSTFDTVTAKTNNRK